MSFLAPIAGAVVGGLMSDGGGGGQQTSERKPWEEAAPWLKDNIKAGQELQQHYQQNPFNQMQQTGYQNLFGDLDNFRGQIAPGIMGFANKLMGSNYQRAAAGTELGASSPYAAQAMQQSMGMGLGGQPAQQGAGMQGARPPMGQQSLLADPMYGRPTGASTPTAGIFGAQQGQSYGLLDFEALNPYNNALKPSDKPSQSTVEQMVADEMARLEADRQYQRRQDWNQGGQGGA